MRQAAPAGATARLLLRSGRQLLIGLAALVLLVVLAAYSTHGAKYALAGGAALLGIGLVAANRVILPCLAVAGTVVIVRLAGATTNLSVSDALLFFATLAALPLLRISEDREVRALLGLVAIYEVMMVVAVLNNPYRSDFIEWFHEAFLAGGSLVIGWVVGREGRARAALLGFLALAGALALWAIAYSPLHHFHPTNLPLGYQKNFVGDLVAFAVLVAYVNPSFLALTRRSRRWVVGICLLGVVASQARQALIGLIVAALFVRARRSGARGQGVLLGLLAAAGLVYVGIEVDKQFRSSNQFNSLHQRLAWYHDSLQLLHLSPWLGEGLRWWYTSRFTFAFQPPNAELEMLTSGGLLGLAAFLVLHGRALGRLRRIDPAFGTLAFAALLMRLVQAQFDIFWVTGQSAIPWLIVGLALGARVLARQPGTPERALRAERPPAALEQPTGPWRWTPSAPHVAARRG